MVGVARTGQRSYDNQATGGQPGQPIAYEMAQFPLHPRPYDGSADGFAYDETRPRRGSTLPRRVRARRTAA